MESLDEAVAGAEEEGMAHLAITAVKVDIKLENALSVATLCAITVPLKDISHEIVPSLQRKRHVTDVVRAVT